MIETIKVSSRGQIVIPEGVRKRFGIKEGSKLILRERDQKLILEKEQDFEKEMSLLEKEQEKKSWLLIAEKSLAKDWDNAKDDEVWSKYL